MVMKDKLVKNNHTGLYYKVRAFAVAFAAFTCLTIAVAVPTYITLHGNNTEIHAENNSSEVIEENNDQGSSELVEFESE